MQKEITVYFEEQESVQIEEYRYIKLKMYLGHTEENHNGYYFSEQSYIDALPSLKNIPIVAKINDIIQDFEGHNTYEDERGIVSRNTDVMGIIPETNNARFEIRNDLASDGIPRKYLVADGLIWTRNIKLLEVLQDKQGVVKNSLEIGKVESTVNDNGVTIVNSFQFEALCLLGDTVGEGMKGSKSFVVFSENSDVTNENINKALKLMEGGMCSMTKEEKEKTLNFEEGSESVSDTSMTDTSSNGEGEGTEDSQDNTVDENVVNETTESEETTTEAETESEEEVETEPTPEVEPEEAEEPSEEEEEPVEPPKKEGEDTEESNSSEGNDKDKEKDKEAPKDAQDNNSVVKDLRKKKKELEQELVTTKVAFEEAVSELEELREYKFKRESEDVQKEFSKSLSADVVASMLEKNKSKGIEAVREALFAELGKKVITKKEGLNFSNNEVATFSVTTKTQDADDDYGIYGKL